MLKHLWSKVFNSQNTPSKSNATQATILKRSEHCVSRKHISSNALKVLSRLNQANYEAYLVGGGVRDLLLGLQPKDFDIATNATPEEIKSLFRNSRIIGRRFKLVHILFGPEIIEVATFRAQIPEEVSQSTHSQGMVLNDNVYGSLEEDAWRRDFSVNALYYSNKDFTIRDFTGGYADLSKQQLKLLGDPITRYREDPVRMLRAVRLSCKLSLIIEETTSAPIKDNANLLQQVSGARLWDESHKLFLEGQSIKIYSALQNYQLFGALFPMTQHELEQDQNKIFETFIYEALKSTDERIASKKTVTPAFLFSVFLWRPMQNYYTYLCQQGLTKQDALHRAMSDVCNEQSQFIAIPRRFNLVIKDIWALQSKLEYQRHHAAKLIHVPKFRAAYDFLLLRASSEPTLQNIAQWWTDYQATSMEDREAMVHQIRKQFKKKRYHRHRKNDSQQS